MLLWWRPLTRLASLPGVTSEDAEAAISAALVETGTTYRKWKKIIAARHAVAGTTVVQVPGDAPPAIVIHAPGPAAFEQQYYAVPFGEAGG
jgi:hypothetical protein